ncbi:MAG: virulence RhuM family protein [Prevotella sp.]|nr:virulence RhuM family protein [Prevotella sp.]
MTALKIFEGKNIRVVFDDELQEWYFSIVDVVEVLADSANPTDYLKKLRKRNPELAQGWGQIVTPLTVDTAGGRQKTNFATKEGIFRIIQFISSPKEEQFKQWVEEITLSSDGNVVQLPDFENIQGEILLYQPDETVRLEVLMENETVWLTQAQIIELFQSSKSNISEHITNIYEQGELVYEATVRNFRTVQKEGDRMVNRVLTYYNLDAIISVGFRVNAKRGIRFRQWANGVIKNYLLRGYAVNQQLMRLEQRMDAKLDAQHSEILKIESTLAEHQEKIDFFVRTNQPPVEGVLFEGQIFDAYKLVEALVKSAKREIILIDNYVDAVIFDLLEKRARGVAATIYTERVDQSLQHLQQLNQQQYRRRIEVKEYNNRFHDRFLILDDALYHFGASFKDLGKRLFAFELMGIDKNIILNQL